MIEILVGEHLADSDHNSDCCGKGQVLAGNQSDFNQIRSDCESILILIRIDSEQTLLCKSVAEQCS